MNECKNAGRNDLTKYFKKYLLQLFFSNFPGFSLFSYLHILKDKININLDYILVLLHIEYSSIKVHFAVSLAQTTII